MPLASCLYECEIAHARTKPRPHSFLHKHFMMYIDLDELACLQSQMRLFSASWSSPYRFRPADYLPGNIQMTSLQDRIKDYARQVGVEERISSIRLLTNVRFLGYVFNPASFFFCFDTKGYALCCLVEVGNTFGEKKAYLLRGCDDGIFRDRQPKLFYVSPFTELSQDFAFKLPVPSETINFRIDTMADSDKVVSSSVCGKRLAFNDRNLLALSLRYPWAPARVIALIHFQSLLLWLKRIPYHKKEQDREKQVAVMNPHRSLRDGLRR